MSVLNTFETELASLLERRQKIQIAFDQANKVIEKCRQEHAEVTGAINLAEKLIAEVARGAEESSSSDTTD